MNALRIDILTVVMAVFSLGTLVTGTLQVVL
jgi:hypothetical protein